MVRIGKRHHQKKRRVRIGLVEPRAGALAEERGGIEVLRNRGPVGLRTDVVVRQALRNDLHGPQYEQETPEYWQAKDASVRTPFYGFDHVTLVRAHGDLSLIHI